MSSSNRGGRSGGGSNRSPEAPAQPAVCAASEACRGGPQPFVLGGIRRLDDLPEPPEAPAPTFLEADHGQVEEQHRVAPASLDPLQAAVDLGANGGPALAVEQQVEDGEKPIPVHPPHEDGPERRQHEREPMLVEEEAERIGEAVRAAPPPRPVRACR